MARKQRDYKAEYARRNELAKERGFLSYNEQRRFIERGQVAPIQPRRIRSERTRTAQAKNKPPTWVELMGDAMRKVGEALDNVIDVLTDGPTQAPENLFRELLKTSTTFDIDKLRAQRFSDNYGNTYMAKYVPSDAPHLGLTQEAYLEAYLAAWVDGDARYHRMRYRGGSDPLYYWLVVLNHYYTPDEYDARYGKTA